MGEKTFTERLTEFCLTLNEAWAYDYDDCEMMRLHKLAEPTESEIEDMGELGDGDKSNHTRPGAKV